MKILKNIKCNFMDIDIFLNTEFRHRNELRAKHTLKSIVKNYIDKI